MTEDVTQTVDIDVPREQVWDLLTDPAELTRWWPDAAELEPRLGGRVVLNFGPGDVYGEITEWEPPGSLAFTWEQSNMPGVRLHVSFTVDDLGDGRSRVSVVHSGFATAPAEARDAVVAGWQHFLPRLAEAASERRDETIEITRRIESPPERVFQALTDAEELTRWFASSADSDPRTGGDFALRFEFDDESQNHMYSGQYEQVTPGQLVRYPWNGAFGETTVEFTLRPDDRATEVRLVHSGWSDEAAETRERHDQGWRFFLDNLGRYMRGGDDERGRAFGMRTATAGASTSAGP